MIFRKYFLLSSDDRKELKRIEKEAYLNESKAIVKEKGINKARKDFKK